MAITAKLSGQEPLSATVAEQEKASATLPGGITVIQHPKHYIPSVTQEDAETMVVSFAPSEDGMEPIDDAVITLPVGPQGPEGPSGVLGTDDTLTLSEDGILSVNTADKPEADNTLPITAAAVHTTVGNIEVLLGTI